jgi:hypothetical protein
MNLVGHLSVALDSDSAPPSTAFLIGCMLPDLAAIARVRIARPGGELGRGVAFHHECDAVFHESAWFRVTNAALRDALLDAGVDTGAARACSHAGVEMLLDGRLVKDATVDTHARLVFGAVSASADALGPLAPDAQRAVWTERLEMIGTSLDPARYQDPEFVAERLQRMTAGRRRIELRTEQVAAVAATLRDAQPAIGDVAFDVVASVRGAVASGSTR